MNNETGIVFALPFADTVSPDVTVKQVKDIQFAVVGDAGLLSNPENGLAEQAEAYSYVSNTSGTIRTSTTLVAITYAISALIGSLAMAFLAEALFIMKLLSHVMAFFLIIAALAGVISQGFGSAASFFQGWIGYTAITSVTTLLFAIVLLIATALIRAGDAILGSWATAMMLWIGVCPALAIFILNWMFKKLFRTRSPFTIRGMQAMAGNPLAVAGAVGGGGALTTNLLEQGRRKLTGAAMTTAKGRLLGRKDTEPQSGMHEQGGLPGTGRGVDDRHPPSRHRLVQRLQQHRPRHQRLPGRHLPGRSDLLGGRRLHPGSPRGVDPQGVQVRRAQSHESSIIQCCRPSTSGRTIGTVGRSISRSTGVVSEQFKARTCGKATSWLVSSVEELKHACQIEHHFSVAVLAERRGAVSIAAMIHAPTCIRLTLIGVTSPCSVEIAPLSPFKSLRPSSCARTKSSSLIKPRGREFSTISRGGIWERAIVE